MRKLKLILLSLIILLITSCSIDPAIKETPTTDNPTEIITPTESEPITPTPEVTPTPDEPTVEDEFEDYGFDVIVIQLSEVNITEDGLYTSLSEVGTYIYTFHKLPKNYKVKGVFNKGNYSSSTLESCGGDRFYNREGLLPRASGRTFTECDIDYRGGNRNAKRIVYSSDFLIFYTDDHYDSFKILRFV